MRAALAVALFALVAARAAAGAPDAPELVDPEGDCAVPYGNLYLDLVAAWVDGEDEDSFLAHLRLARFEPALAAGSGLALTFEHQGARYGVIAAELGPTQGWGFWTGTATETAVDASDEAPGSFDAATATLTVEFPKWRFPHDDPDDRELTGFRAFTADIRPMIPFELADQDGNGKWIVCDTAEGGGTYTFASGTHGPDHAPSAEAATTPHEVAATPEAAPAAAPATAKATPAAPAVLLLGAAALAARLRR